MEEDLQKRAQIYARRNGRELAEYVDAGKDGTVWVLKSQTNPLGSVVKIHHDPAAYWREVRCYERLREKRIRSVRSSLRAFALPRLLGHDPELLALEITVVSPPFLVDFASAWLDTLPDFSEEVWEQWAADYAEKFGDLWEKVEEVLFQLKMLGINQLDPSPSNIRFG